MSFLTGVLRGEWGFNGAVISDYNTKPYMDTDRMIRAGGDISLGPGMKTPSDTESATAVTQLRAPRKIFCLPQPAGMQ